MKIISLTQLGSWGEGLGGVPISLHVHFLTGEKVQTAEPSGQDEGDGAYGGRKVQAFCLQSGGEEPGSHQQVGGEVTGIHQQLPGALWTRRSLGESTMVHWNHSNQQKNAPLEKSHSD